jgi:hypothetical protein
MGNTWTVEVYGQWFGMPGYSFKQVYGGESFIGALRSMWAHRRYGSGCIQLSWRPVRDE